MWSREKVCFFFCVLICARKPPVLSWWDHKNSTMSVQERVPNSVVNFSLFFWVARVKRVCVRVCLCACMCTVWFQWQPSSSYIFFFILPTTLKRVKKNLLRIPPYFFFYVSVTFFAWNKCYFLYYSKMRTASSERYISL